jgi:hypothetical protein
MKRSQGVRNRATVRMIDGAPCLVRKLAGQKVGESQSPLAMPAVEFAEPARPTRPGLPIGTSDIQLALGSITDAFNGIVGRLRAGSGTVELNAGWAQSVEGADDEIDDVSRGEVVTSASEEELEADPTLEEESTRRWSRGRTAPHALAELHQFEASVALGNARRGKVQHRGRGD